MNSTTKHLWIPEALRREKGSALIVALFSLLLASLIGLSLAFNGIYEVKVSRNYNTATDAFYIAEAGMNHAVTIITDNDLDFAAILKGADGLSGTVDDGVLTLTAIPAGDRIPAAGVNFGTGKYTVVATDGSGGAATTLVVTCTGTGTNNSTSIVESRLVRSVGGGGSGSSAAGEYGVAGSAAADSGDAGDSGWTDSLCHKSSGTTTTTTVHSSTTTTTIPANTDPNGGFLVGPGGATSVTVSGNGSMTCNVLTPTALTISGNGTLTGYAYSLGVNTSITMSGNAKVIGNAVSTNNISLSGNAVVTGNKVTNCDSNGNCPAAVPEIPAINLEEYRNKTTGNYQYYTLTSDGKVKDAAGNIKGYGSGSGWNGWKKSGSTWSLSGNSTIEGSFFVEGSCSISGNHGTASNPLHNTIFATGHITLSGNVSMVPSYGNCAMVAGTDINISGNVTTKGWMGAHEQVSLSGNGSASPIDGPVFVQNAASTDSSVSVPTLSGNGSVDCAGSGSDGGGSGSSPTDGLHGVTGGTSGTIVRISWREIRN